MPVFLESRDGQHLGGCYYALTATAVYAYLEHAFPLLSFFYAVMTCANVWQ
jgi:hypothetical protein